MSQLGEKRPAEKQIGPGDEEDGTDAASQKRSAPGFVFRPSSLQKATQGFALKQPSLKPQLESHTPSKPDEPVSKKDTSRSPKGGFLKLNSDEIKPITITTPTIMLSGHGSGGLGKATNQITGRGANEKGGDGSAENHDAHRENPFLQFLSPSCPPPQSFSSLSSTGASAFSAVNSSNSLETSIEHSTSDNKEEYQQSETNSTGLEPDPPPSTPQLPFGSQPATAILPEIETPTGEEGEKKIVQVPARLYAFDVVTHSWKERGRGEVRLNDAFQSEGVFQSRLVMRASGSYRVLLNTHLWAQMKCDRANQKNIRITAQSTDGKISVFLIMGAAKDIQQLFTAIDRRIEALKRNIQHSQESSEQQNEAFRLAAPTASTSFDEDDKESFFDEHHSSPESSPETHTSTRLRQVETNPVPVPEQRASSNSRSSIVSAGGSDCEGGRGKQEEEVGKEEKDSGAKKLSEVPSESSTSAATMRNNSSNLPEPT